MSASDCWGLANEIAVRSADVQSWNSVAHKLAVHCCKCHVFDLSLCHKHVIKGIAMQKWKLTCRDNMRCFDADLSPVAIQ